MVWAAANLTLGLGCLKNFKTTIVIGVISEISFIYSPTEAKAIIAV